MKKTKKGIRAFTAVLFVAFSLSTHAQAFIDATVDAASLPVTYFHFTGNKVNNTVQLKWTTAAEFNNSHFNIQRSSNGITFRNIARMAGKGTSSVFTNYSFVDSVIQTGNLYYRLEQVDLDGKSSNSSIVLIKHAKNNKTELSVYPNPISGGKAFMSLTGTPEGKYSYSIMNSSGKLISSNLFNHAGSMSTTLIQMPNNIAAGVYALIVYNAQGEKTASKQIIIR